MAAAAPALARQQKPADPLSVRLFDSVGKGRRNLVADVQTWQRRFNALIAEHYLNGNEWNPLDEAGILDDRSATSISQLEQKYFGLPRKAFVEPNDRLDKFTRELACGPLDVKDSMYALAHHMLPAGGDVYVSERGGEMHFDHGNIRGSLPKVYAALEEQNLDDTNILLVAPWQQLPPKTPPSSRLEKPSAVQTLRAMRRPENGTIQRTTSTTTVTETIMSRTVNVFGGGDSSSSHSAKITGNSASKLVLISKSSLI